MASTPVQAAPSGTAQASEETPARRTGWFGPPQFVTPDNLGTTAGPYQASDPNISGDGSVVVYDSDRTDLITPDLVGWDVFYEVGGHRYLPYDQTNLIVRGTTYDTGCPNVSRNGRVILFCSVSPSIVRGDRNRTEDLFAYDRATGTTQRVNLAADGSESVSRYGTRSAEAAISADGRYVAFVSADPLVPKDTNGVNDVYVRDLTAQTTTRVSVSTAGRQGPYSSGQDGQSLGISGDGRYVTFSSFSDALVPGDHNHIEDVLLHDRLTGTTELVSVDDDGTQQHRNPVFGRNSYTASAYVSDNGRYVTFTAQAVGLDGLTRQFGEDVYLRDRIRHTTRLISRHHGTPSGLDHDNGSAAGSMTPDGRYVTFLSTSRIMNPPVRGEQYNTYSRAYYAFIYVVATGQVIRFPDYSAGAYLSADATTVIYQKGRIRTPAQSIATRTLHLPG
ncbi:hypothetical protein V3N99_22120 (plasmid) [Dermatophilaceae bacterium Soc4.6]